MVAPGLSAPRLLPTRAVSGALPSLLPSSSSFLELPAPPRPPQPTFRLNPALGDGGSAYWWWMFLSKMHIVLSLAYLAYIFAQVTMQDRTLWFLQGPADSPKDDDDGEDGAEEATNARISKLEQAIFGGGRRDGPKVPTMGDVARAEVVKEKAEVQKATAVPKVETLEQKTQERASAVSDALGKAKGTGSPKGRGSRPQVSKTRR